MTPRKNEELAAQKRVVDVAIISTASGRHRKVSASETGYRDAEMSFLASEGTMSEEFRPEDRDSLIERLESNLRIVALGVLAPEPNQSYSFHDAFEQVRSHIGRRSEVMMFRLGARNHRLAAAEAVSDWYTRMLESGFRYWDQSLPIFPLACFVLDCCCYSYLRRKHLLVSSASGELVGDDEAPGSALESAEQKEGLHKALQSLSAKQREAIQLVYLNGRNAKEAADQLGTTVEIIYQRCHSARRRLEALLSDLGLWDSKKNRNNSCPRNQESCV